MTAVKFLLNGKACSEDSAPPSMTVWSHSGSTMPSFSKPPAM